VSGALVASRAASNARGGAARAFGQRQEVSGGAVDQDVQRAEALHRERHRALGISLRGGAR
jgi:hypothetical protein